MLCDKSGGRGTRTPKGLRPPHFECGALPVRTSPPERGSRWYMKGSRAPARELAPTDSLVLEAVRALIGATVGETGFEPATPASRTQCSTGLSYSPNDCANRLWVARRISGRTARGTLRLRGITCAPLRTGWDSNPREPFGPDGLANRCRNHLATPPKLPLLGSNQDSSDPESDVLPVTPRGKKTNFV